MSRHPTIIFQGQAVKQKPIVLWIWGFSFFFFGQNLVHLGAIPGRLGGMVYCILYYRVLPHLHFTIEISTNNIVEYLSVSHNTPTEKHYDFYKQTWS